MERNLFAVLWNSFGKQADALICIADHMRISCDYTIDEQKEFSDKVDKFILLAREIAKDSKNVWDKL